MITIPIAPRIVAPPEIYIPDRPGLIDLPPLIERDPIQAYSRRKASARHGARKRASGGTPSDPLAIFSSRLFAWYQSDDLSLSGTDVLSYTDKSGNGNTLPPTGSGYAAYEATGGPSGGPAVNHASSDEYYIAVTAPVSGSYISLFLVTAANVANDGAPILLDGDQCRIGFVSDGTKIDIRYSSSIGGYTTTFSYGSSWHRYWSYQRSDAWRFTIDGTLYETDSVGTISSDAVDIALGHAYDGKIVLALYVSGFVTEAEVTDLDTWCTSQGF